MTVKIQRCDFRHHQRQLKGLLLASSAAIWTLGASAFAQTAEHKFDIPAQDTASALREFGRQSGTELLFPFDSAAGHKSPAIKGKMSDQEALSRLAASAGLVVLSNDGKTATLGPKDGDPTRSPKKLGAAKGAVPSGTEAEPEEIVVTAQKREERLKDVPVPVALIDAQKLADNDQFLLKDYASSIPGFVVTPNYVSRQDISLRGIGAGAMDNTTVGFVIDETPFGASTNHGSSVPDFDPGDLARVEVLRGPQGTLYGSNSMGGLVKFVTVDPSTAGFSGRVEAGTSGVQNGNGPGYDVRTSANVPLTDNLAARISGFTRLDPGYIDNILTGQKGINEQKASGARLSLLWRPGDDISIKFNALYQHYNWDGLNEVDVGLGDLKQNYIAHAGRGERIVQAYSAIVKAQLGGIDLTSVTGYNVNRNTLSLDISSFFAPNLQDAYGAPGGLYAAPNDDTNRLTQEFRFSSSIGESLDWVVGAFYSHEVSKFIADIYAEDPAGGPILGRYLYGNSGEKFQEGAIFADVTYRITDRIDIQLGGRESRDWIKAPVNITSGLGAAQLDGADPFIIPPISSASNVFTYLVTPRFRVSPDLMLYARFASGYRPGGPNPGGPAGLPLQFNPDKTDNYEVGIKGDFFDHALSVDASLYYVDWSNIQFGAQVTIDGVPYNFTDNGSEAKSEGVELSVTSKPWSGLTLNASFSYDDAVLTQSFPSTSVAYGAKGDRIPFTSRVSAYVSAEQEFPVSDEISGFVGGAFSYVGSREGPFTGAPGAPASRQDFPAYTKLDLHGGARFAPWTVNVFINNVLDRRGLLDGGDGYFYSPARIFITPRTVGFNVIRTF